MVWRQIEPPTDTWSNGLHWIAPPASSFVHSEIEHEATNRAVLPELHHPIRQEYHPQNIPSCTFDPLANNALSPSPYPPPDAANAHFYGLSVQPSIPGFPSIATSTSIANGPKSPIFSNLSPDTFQSTSTNTMLLRVAFPSRKLSGSPDLVPTLAPPGEPAAMANQGPSTIQMWNMYAWTSSTRPRVCIENTTWETTALQKRSRGRRVAADVLSPLAQPPVPDTVIRKRELSSLPPWDLREMEGDWGSDTGNAAKISGAGLDYRCVCTPTTLFLVYADPPFC